MIPMSSSGLENRRRKAYSPRRTLVRSNSSLLGSIKNFVAAPFTRLFTAPADDFDDPTDFSGKRRRLVNHSLDNNVVQEDGPAPAKRMRVRSPESSPIAYLDPPTSAFQQKPNYSSNNISNRSSSTTIQDPATVNTRSTVSPLRRQLSQTMTIDPSNNNRSLSRDISMQSIPLYNADNRNTQSISTARDPSSMPPMTGRPFRMRTSLTPQPLQQHREASEPPALSALHSNPMFVRAPTQPPAQGSESQTNPTVTTLGSLVGSQRSSRPPVRQHSSLLFGTPPPSATPEAANAEKVLRELDFYKTPLVPTRIRSKMSKPISGSSSTSSITDMFSRRHPLVLMGDHDRPSKKDRKKEKAKEANRTKPYAGTGGIKKRLAKARGTPEPEKEKAANRDAAHDIIPEPTSAPVPAPVSEIPPPPPPQEKDTFSVNHTPMQSSPQASSLRVGRAPRSHLSRPPRPTRSSKFSAAFDEDDDISEDSRKDMEMLEEAAKRAPVFDVPAGFRFPEIKPLEQTTVNAKEPPIPSLPFSFAKPVTSSDVLAAPASIKPTSPLPAVPVLEVPSFATNTAPLSVKEAVQSTTLFPPASEHSASDSTETAPPAKKASDFFSRPAAPLTPPAETARPSPPIISIAPPSTTVNGQESETENTTKVPNFFASSKLLSAPGPVGSATSAFSAAPATTDTASTATPTASLFGASAPLQSTEEEKKTSAAQLFSFGPPKADSATSTPLTFGFDKQHEASSAAAGASEEAKKTESQSFSFGQPSSSAQPASSSPFSFGKPAETSSMSSSSSFSFGTGPSTESAQKSFQFGHPSSTSTTANGGLFGNGNNVTKPDVAAPSTGFGFGQSPASTDGPTGSLFGSSTGNAEPAKTSSTFLFGQPQKVDQPKVSPFESSSNTGNQSTPFSFASSTSQQTSSPFGFGGGASSANTDNSKPFSFGVTAPARPATPPNQDQEIRMDESPVRDIKPTESKSSVGFSFTGSSAPAPLFGQASGTSNPSAPASTGFSFGMNNTGNTNPFGTMKSDDKPAESKPFGSGSFGQSSNNSPFGFGSAKAPETESSRPSTASGFGSGSSSFTFGPGNNSNPFGQSSGSAPASPSTFSQPSASFTFGSSSSTTNNSNPFAFGSPAASPATPSTALPSGGFGTGSTGFGTASTPSTPTFGAAGGTSSGGGNLFTIGAAPTASPGGAGARIIKKLPRRGGKR